MRALIGIAVLLVAALIVGSFDFADAKKMERAACQKALLGEGSVPEGVDCSPYVREGLAG